MAFFFFFSNNFINFNFFFERLLYNYSNIFLGSFLYKHSNNKFIKNNYINISLDTSSIFLNHFNSLLNIYKLSNNFFLSFFSVNFFSNIILLFFFRCFGFNFKFNKLGINK